MATRNRLDYSDKSFLKHTLMTKVNSVIRHHSRQCPLTLEQQEKIWNSGFACEFMEAYDIVLKAGYVGTGIHSDDVYFVTDTEKGKFIIELYHNKAGYPYLKQPTAGSEFSLPAVQVGGREFRYIPWDEIVLVLGEDKASEFLEWMQLASIVRGDVNRAVSTVNAVVDMLSTVGQLRRMVPDIVRYLTDGQQRSIRDQQRNSPYPAEWATFDKSNVEHLLLQLARGHLVSDPADPVPGNSTSTWATLVPE